MIDRIQIQAFQDLVWHFFGVHRRDLPWRHPEADGSFDPYKVLVSEMMLQQTQVIRVVPKYQSFLKRFPTAYVLARSPLRDVLHTWSGLGYNRRAKFLWQAAGVITQNGGLLPKQQALLTELPGIGPGTAAAIMVYAYNRPVVFVETNIRTVFIRHFFPDKSQVSDAQILPLVQQTLPIAAPSVNNLSGVINGSAGKPFRAWYWALMDYGSWLKRTYGNPNERSTQYKKQSPFEGSRRQLRGKVLRLLHAGPRPKAQLRELLNDERAELVLTELVQESLVKVKNNQYSL